MNIENENTAGSFADLLLPVPIPKLFTYHIPTSLVPTTTIGSRVVVQFGRRRILTGIIKEIHYNPPDKYKARPILEVLDDHPMVKQLQLKLKQYSQLELE